MPEHPFFRDFLKIDLFVYIILFCATVTKPIVCVSKQIRGNGTGKESWKLCFGGSEKKKKDLLLNTKEINKTKTTTKNKYQRPVEKWRP